MRRKREFCQNQQLYRNTNSSLTTLKLRKYRRHPQLTFNKHSFRRRTTPAVGAEMSWAVISMLKIKQLDGSQDWLRESKSILMILSLLTWDQLKRRNHLYTGTVRGIILGDWRVLAHRSKMFKVKKAIKMLTFQWGQSSKTLKTQKS